MKNLFFYQTEIGRIGIAERNNSITDVFFETDEYPGKTGALEGFVILETELLKRAGTQLKEYLGGKRRSFELSLAPEGTDFMKNVWKSLCDIPYGKTRSYKDIAETVGNSKAYRAVGLANNRNPIPLFIPCHRIIGTDGKLTGYRGGLEIKSKLLEIEKTHGKLTV